MNLNAVEAIVKKIDEIKGDDEAAHSLEDWLYRELLDSIAKGECDDPVACAETALLSQDIDFERWCA